MQLREKTISKQETEQTISIDNVQASPKNGSAPRESRERNRGGVKFFKGSGLPDQTKRIQFYKTITADDLRDARNMQRRVWRPEETIEAAKLFFEKGRINIVGEPQSGKGTILYGLSEICHRNGWGYVFIDGHHQETPAGFVVSNILKAERERFPILFDSFDYLFAKGKKRETPLVKQRGRFQEVDGKQVFVEGRTEAIIKALDCITVPVAITHHDEEWAKQLTDVAFREQFRPYLNEYPTYEIPLNFLSDESIVRFLVDQRIPRHQAEFLIRLEENARVMGVLTSEFGDKQVVGKITQAVRNYPVLKELVRGGPNDFDEQGKRREGRAEEFLPLLDDVSHVFSSHLKHVPNLNRQIVEMARIILEAEYKRVFLTLFRK